MNIGKMWSIFILNFSPRKLETPDHLETFFRHFKVCYLQRGKEHHNNTAVSEKGLIKKKKKRFVTPHQLKFLHLQMA